MQPSSAPSTPQSVGPDDPAYDAAIQAATAPARQAFGDRVRVEVSSLNRAGRWVFLQGRLRGSDGGRPDFTGSAYARPAAAGQVSDRYVALVKHTAPTIDDNAAHNWQLLEHSIGPSDVSWQNWPEEHDAPHALFGF